MIAQESYGKPLIVCKPSLKVPNHSMVTINTTPGTREVLNFAALNHGYVHPNWTPTPNTGVENRKWEFSRSRPTPEKQFISGLPPRECLFSAHLLTTRPCHHRNSTLTASIPQLEQRLVQPQHHQPQTLILHSVAYLAQVQQPSRWSFWYTERYPDPRFS